MAWTKVLEANALSSGGREVVKVGDRKILVLNHNNELYAVENKCPHLNVPLKSGKIQDGSIVCVFHRSAFDLNTGEVKAWCTFPPVVGNLLGKVSKEKSLPVFPVRVENGSIEVDLTD